MSRELLTRMGRVIQAACAVAVLLEASSAVAAEITFLNPEGEAVAGVSVEVRATPHGSHALSGLQAFPNL